MNTIKVGQKIRFAYHGRMRNVQVEKVGNGYITGIVMNEANKPKSFRLQKMFATQVLMG